MERAKVPWMQDLLVACQEIQLTDLQLYRQGEAWNRVPAAALAPRPEMPLADADADADGMQAANPDDRGDGEAAGEAVEPDIVTKALKWVTSVKDDGILRSLQLSLPPIVLDEQIRAFRLSLSLIHI